MNIKSNHEWTQMNTDYQDSKYTYPKFHYSNWGEASKFYIIFV